MNAVLKQPIYQVKLGARWEDMELGIDLPTLSKELSAASGSMTGILAARTGTNLNKINNLVLKHYNATRQVDPTVFDLKGLRYSVDSYEDDVLKINFEFIIRYGNDKDTERSEKVRIKHAAKEAKTKSSWPLKDVVKLPKHIKGTITLMPGN